jgi:predicted nucleic acid-binding protein
MLRWLLDDVPEQFAAVDRLLADGGQYRLADVAMVEVGFVLERVLQLSRALVADNLAAVLAVASIEVDRPLWHRAIAEYRSHPKLSIADCYLATQAGSTGQAPLYTFDRKLANQLDAAQLLRA